MRNRKQQAENYRNKAEEARMIGDTMRDADTKHYMMGVARDYEMMARVLELTHLGDMLPASE